MNDFIDTKNNELKAINESTDLEFLKKELVKTEKTLPECAAESLFRTNKLNVITNRIKALTCFIF